MNKMQLKEKLKVLSKERNVDFNTLLRLYMYDRFIVRLWSSQYKDNFVLKGGFYLSAVFGIENRATMDIDTSFTNADFSEEVLTKMIKEIVAINLNDNATISFIGISSIRDEDEYGGYRIDLEVKIDNIKEKFHLDVATGDPITPKEIRYDYLPLFDEQSINIPAYNMETVLAEKVETILSRVELNSRMRDFYDMYLIYSREWNGIINDLSNALENTFKKRGFNGNISKTIDTLRKSNILESRWISYQRKYEYAKDIKYAELMECLQTILNSINIDCK